MRSANRYWWILPFSIGILLWGVWSIMFSSTPLKEGSRAPDFSLTTHEGKPFRLSEHRGQWVVLMFYPKAMTPGCTVQNCSIRDSYEKLSRYATVVGISVDSVETQRKFAEQNHLKHILLADEKGEVAEMYGVRTSAGFASRTTFVISPDGVIAKVFEKAGTSSHAEELLAYFARRTSADSTPEKPEIGKKVPDFTLPNCNLIEGAPKEVTLSKIKDKKAIVIIFVATRCPVSLAYDARMVALAKEFEPKGVHFLGINSNHIEPADEVTAHAKEKGFPFPVLKDEGNRVADAYNAKVTPEVFVVDSKGVLRYHGAIDDSQNESRVSQRYLREVLNALVAGREPAVKETRAFGCTIKRVPTLQNARPGAPGLSPGEEAALAPFHHHVV